VTTPRATGCRLIPEADCPLYLRALVRALDGTTVSQLSLPLVARPMGTPRRKSAVLILLADGPQGPDLLLTARAATLRSHAGQPAFPGGAAEPGEDAVATALREAQEETGLDPASVTAVALLPELFLPPSGYLVAPVLGHWERPGPVAVVDPAETAVVARVPVSTLADPACRGRIRFPGGQLGPAFDLPGLLVWGFTGALVDLVLRLGGWARPWDADRRFELPERAG